MRTSERRKRPLAATLPRSTLVDSAYATLKRRIITCEIEPGLRITEAQLVEGMGIGKTPVREALARLAQEGLVRSIPHHGYEVSSITLRDVQELFGLRLIVEPAAVQLAAGHVDATHLRRLDELCQAGYDLGDRESASRFLRANHEFHATVAQASGNQRLVDVVVRVLDESERLFHLGLMLRNRTHEMAHEHRSLVDALVAGDGESARRIVVEQIVAAERMVVNALLSSPAVQSVRVEIPKVPKVSA
jgi:DNA-binding GntR family transcriptional regulator